MTIITSEEQLQWHKWEEAKPAAFGVYFWRVKSEKLPGESIAFTAELSSVNDIIVPPFFKWNGWAPVFPSCEWAEPIVPLEAHGRGDCKNLSIVGLNFARCPFCGETPTLRGMRSGYDGGGGGVVITADPHEYNCWWLKCCEWGKTPSYKDPRRLEEARQQAFNRIRTGEI